MKRILLISALLMSITILTRAQDTAQLLRTPYKLTVAVDKKHVYEEDIKATPYLLPDKSVQLYPGETVYIEVEQNNGVIKSMKAVKENTNPAKTLELSFTQTAEKKVHQVMMLKVKNPFQQALVYKAFMYPLTAKRWVPTDVLPVEATLFGMETWPDIITSIALSGWAFQAK